MEFLECERRPILKATLRVWIARHERIRSDWPSLTVNQWEGVLRDAIAQMLVVEEGDLLRLPSKHEVKKESQGSLF
jgi:hypothetical protein